MPDDPLSPGASHQDNPYSSMYPESPSEGPPEKDVAFGRDDDVVVVFVVFVAFVVVVVVVVWKCLEMVGN